MSVDVRLENLHTQSPVMTLQLQQAIRLLGLNNLELKHFIEQELVQNTLQIAAKYVRQKLNAPIQSYVAKRWMAGERKARRR